MAMGPGKFDDALTKAREMTGAAGGVLILFGAPGGRGFSCQTTPLQLLALPDILRQMAEQIEKDIPADLRAMAHEKGLAYTCPRCMRTSYNANDVAQKYCGHCHEFEAG